MKDVLKIVLAIVIIVVAWKIFKGLIGLLGRRRGRGARRLWRLHAGRRGAEADQMTMRRNHPDYHRGRARVPCVQVRQGRDQVCAAGDHHHRCFVVPGWSTHGRASEAFADGLHRAARGQGPHLHQPLRVPVAVPQGGGAAGRLGRHQGADGARPGCDHRQGQGVGAARARRRRLPDRHEVELHAQGAQARETQLPGDQRRRIRARIVQGPRDHPPRPAQIDRRFADRRLRHARTRRLHLYPRRIHPGNQGVGARGCRGL